MEQMMNSIARDTTRTLVPTDVKKDGSRLVLACGYEEGGKFGYFVIWEKPHPDGIEYTDTCYFIEKRNERSFRQALDELARIAKQYK